MPEGMIKEVVPPGVDHRQEPELGPQVLRVPGGLAHSLGGGARSGAGPASRGESRGEHGMGARGRIRKGARPPGGEAASAPIMRRRRHRQVDRPGQRSDRGIAVVGGRVNGPGLNGVQLSVER